MKQPAFMWFPKDHRSDAALQACTFEARAVWRDMLDLMHDGEPYGHLTAGGEPVTPKELASIVRISPAKCRRCLQELEKRKVFSRTPDGVIYSRRMVRDERTRQARAAGGAKSLENPNVPRRAGQRSDREDRPPAGIPSAGPLGGPLGGSSAGPSEGSSDLSPAVAVASAVAVPSADDVVDADPSAAGSVVEQAREYALGLCAAANRAIAEKWGEQPTLLPYASALPLAARLTAAGVDLDAACESIARQCKQSRKPEPPASPNWFEPGILAECSPEEHRWSQAAAVAPRALRANRSADPRVRAVVLVGTIRGFIQESYTGAGGTRFYIPRASVEALGRDVLAAYDSVGGSDRFTKTPGDKWGLLLRDFGAALEAHHQRNGTGDSEGAP